MSEVFLQVADEVKRIRSMQQVSLQLSLSAYFNREFSYTKYSAMEATETTKVNSYAMSIDQH